MRAELRSCAARWAERLYSGDLAAEGPLRITRGARSETNFHKNCKWLFRAGQMHILDASDDEALKSARGLH